VAQSGKDDEEAPEGKNTQKERRGEEGNLSEGR